MSQTRKSTEKEKHASSGLQKKFSSIGKVESKTKEESNQENSNNKNSDIIEQEIQENNIGISNDDVNIPSAEVIFY